MADFSLEIDDRDVLAHLDGMPQAVHNALLKKITALSLLLETKIKSDKLSGQVLNVRSGALRRSIFSSVQDDGQSIIGSAASSGDVKYGRVHEFGGQINIPDIYPVKAQALHFVIGGKEVFAKHVRAHTVTMPMRSFMRSSLEDMRGAIVQGMKDAVTEGLGQ